MFKTIKDWFKPKPYELKEYNVGKLFAEIQFDNGEIIKKEFVGYIEQEFCHHRMFSFPKTAKSVYTEWKEKLNKSGFIDMGDNKEIPLCRIKEIRTNYEGFIIKR